ncbi:WD40-repeat-containing domain protein [Flagelloscypha sp. PMI_526]|nr:WD40-repeat-containing domain protein [Flagelloscypha sp. PMI_526]
MADPNANQLCDTLPAPRLASSTVTPRPPLPSVEMISPPSVPDPATPRKLCVRHQRMADEGTNIKLQQALDKLPLEERQAVNAVWSSFSSSSHPRRALILQGLLTMCCFSQLSLLTEHLAHLIRIDPFAVLPAEVNLRILRYLDATSLCRASQVARRWKALADDDTLWKGICEQHIGRQCHKCGWGLPILQKRYRSEVGSPSPGSSSSCQKRPLTDEDGGSPRPAKRHRVELSPEHPVPTLLAPSPIVPPQIPRADSFTRPWKDVYSERMTIERNWRRGQYKGRVLKGHTDGVMCLQFIENLPCPDFSVLITGSYDRTARVWNLDTGAELQVLRGHERAIRALQFDRVKLITGSLDSTIRVWDWRHGKCIRTLTGHTDGVVALHFDENVLASGSVDTTVRVWNVRTGGAFTLRGHEDWVNDVQLWDSNSYYGSSSSMSTTLATSERGSSPSGDSPQIDPGKMLFTGSDDGTMRLWDLTSRTCVRIFSGHIGQVQSIRLLLPDECGSGKSTEDEDVQSVEPLNDEGVTSDNGPIPSGWPLFSNPKKPVLVSGSLDNTMQMWDIDTGKSLRTCFGHIEGIWGVSADKLRLATASQDRTIKLWSRDSATAMSTLVGHRGAVCCLQVAEDKIVSGSDDFDIRVWSFAE